MEGAPQLGRRHSISSQPDQYSQQTEKDGPNSSSYQENTDPVVKSTDMPDVMQTHAIQCTQKAIEQAQQEGAKKSDFHNFLAKTIKKEFDATYGGVWHAIVGRNFGSFVVHQSRTFIYFYLGQTAVLLFKSGSQAL